MIHLRKFCRVIKFALITLTLCPPIYADDLTTAQAQRRIRQYLSVPQTATQPRFLDPIRFIFKKKRSQSEILSRLDTPCSRVILQVSRGFLNDMIRTAAMIPTRDFKFEGQIKHTRAQQVIYSIALTSDENGFAIHPYLSSEIVDSLLSKYDSTTKLSGVITKIRDPRTGRMTEIVENGSKRAEKHQQALNTFRLLVAEDAEFPLSDLQWEQAIENMNRNGTSAHIMKLLLQTIKNRESQVGLRSDQKLVDQLWNSLLKNLRVISKRSSTEEIVDLLTQLLDLEILPSEDLSSNLKAIRNLSFLGIGPDLPEEQREALYISLVGELFESTMNSRNIRQYFNKTKIDQKALRIRKFLNRLE
jgi:hypothetical protein